MRDKYERLTPKEELGLTAKAAAYRALADHEESLFAKAGIEDHEAKTETLRLIRGIHNFKLASNDDLYLTEVGRQLGINLKPYFKPENVALELFLSSYTDEIKKYRSIKDEIEAWFNAFSSASSQYFRYGTDPKYPALQLEYEIGGTTAMGLSARTEPSAEKKDHRTIVLIFNPAKFDNESYFAIPYVLSHEFWCHGLSRWMSPPDSSSRQVWTGCSPQDSWEEGWMDFVQFEILKTAGPEVCKSATIESLVMHHSLGLCYARYAGDELILRGMGYRAADSFYRFVKSRERELDIDLNAVSVTDLFTLFSLELNALDCGAKVKNNFVRWIWGFLNPNREERTWREGDLGLVQQRETLLEILRGNLRKSLVKHRKLDVLKLLSLSGHLN
jgi:hypothetical protein